MNLVPFALGLLVGAQVYWLAMDRHRYRRPQPTLDELLAIKPAHPIHKIPRQHERLGLHEGDHRP